MSSAELGVYAEAGARLLANLNNMLAAFDALSVEYIEVPNGTVSFDFLVPRSAFDNHAGDFLGLTKSFVDVVEYIQELVTGTSKAPELVYASTSDPVTGLAVVTAVATPVMIFYKQIVDTAKQSIELIKAVKAMREMFPGIKIPEEANVGEKVKQLTREAAENAIKEISASTGTGVDASRVAELTNAISMKSTTLVTAVANGARVSITLESQLTLDRDLGDKPDQLEQLHLLMEAVKPQEQMVTDSLRLLNQKVPLLSHGAQ